MESITKNLGIVLLIAAGLRALNLAEFSTTAQLGFALSALFITLADVSEFEESITEQRMDSIERKASRKALQKKIETYHLLAIFSLVALPNIRFDLLLHINFFKNFFSWYVTNINDAVTLVALGLVIYLIALKKKWTYKKKLQEMIKKKED